MRYTLISIILILSTSLYATTLSFSSVSSWQAATAPGPETLEDFTSIDPLGKGFTLSIGEVNSQVWKANRNAQGTFTNSVIVTINFFEPGTSNSTTIFGAGVTAANGSTTELRAFDINNNLLGTTQFVNAQFGGFTSTEGIARLEVQNTTAFTQFDNLRFTTFSGSSVPEPSSLALIFLATLFVGFVRKSA